MDIAERPLLALTIGDPSGIGPEITLKALTHREVFAKCRPVVVGDRRVLTRAMPLLGDSDLTIFPVDDPAAGVFEPGFVSLIDVRNADPRDCPIGHISAVSGNAAVEYVFVATDLAIAGDIDGIVTAPLNKAAMHAAGFSYAGHTELLAERTNADKVSMLLVGPNLKVVHVSTPVALEEAIRRVTRQRVEEVIDIAWQSCVALGVDDPLIAVAGLNPHAGEGGIFGKQEIDEIQPAIDAARSRGLRVTDPQPGDTVFLRATKGAFDIVVAMYHDQGHIPMKLLAFDSGVNVSVGLPIIRTSVDHGTAFDIAGQGIASEESMLAAIDVAVRMVRARRPTPH
ncbi:MAG: 4-hydroxythreonine-4-phosphate dehydrogenase PdxA [Thermomicrobiales bacterium]|nr:4-hydroxythreonine-4-phosphate dehydrogenase PdxA [Thermomicrobiales bacterium]